MGLRPSSNIAVLKPDLRLTPLIDDSATPAQTAAARRAIAQENHTAALGADDARWLFAQSVENSIEGGRAAIMRPNVRRQLVANAEKMGLRPFDANLVIAIVQDAARHSEPLDHTASGRLAILPAPREVHQLKPLTMFAATVLIAAAALAFLVAWVLG